MKATTVYLYMHHNMGSMAHTLFAIPIDSSNFNKNNNHPLVKIGTKNPTGFRNIEPLIEFPGSEYPQLMACAKLGSKFYFLGGERSPPDHPDDPNHIYPNHVYVFDEGMYRSQSKSKPIIQKLEVGMSTGKPRPVAFAADGKLFILGSCGGPNLITYLSVWPTHFAASSFRFFEVYDPTTNEWTLLDDPPVTTPTLWVSPPVVVGRKVYLYGEFFGRGGSGVLLCFHLDSYQWVDPVRTSKDVQRLRPGCMLVGDTYYGIRKRGAEVVRQKLMQEDEQLLFRLLSDNHSFSSHGFCHLWDRHFCTVVTGSFPDPLLPLYFRALDQSRRYFCIRVFREIPTEEGPQSIPSELLYSADYLFQSTYSSFGILLGCYPCDTNNHPNDFGAEVSQEKRKEKKMLRKHKKKEKKMLRKHEKQN